MVKWKYWEIEELVRSSGNVYITMGVKSEGDLFDRGIKKC